MSLSKIILTDWNICKLYIRNIIPFLDHNNHKGEMGRIGIIGGSLEYTGAPYYAGQSALKFGADLAFIYCSESALIPIKSYSPELMVVSFYNDIDININTIIKNFNRMHVLVIGPGLGRNTLLIDGIGNLITAAKSNNLPIVIDADGLWILSNNINAIKGYNKCVLTPNKPEYDRLLASVIDKIKELNTDSIDQSIYQDLQSTEDSISIKALCKYLNGVTIIRKGEVDLISSGDDVYKISENGSPRRCGGQGDILAGSLGVALHWALNIYKQCDYEAYSPIISACILATINTRRAGYLAYNKQGRSMTSPDVINMIGTAFSSLEHDNN